MAWRLIRLLPVATMLWPTACPRASGRGDPDTDNGNGDNGAVQIAPPAPPEIPWLEAGRPPIAGPALTPCPRGWREVTDPQTGTVTCDPWPQSGRQQCTAVDEAHFPGELGCVRIGTPCPEGEWADDIPPDHRVLYVRAGAPPGGDGSMAAPFRTVAEATAAATSGTVIALGKGTFDEAVRLPAGVTLWGACVAETLVTCSAGSETAGTITVLGRGTAIRNLRVSGARPGVWIVGMRSVELENVLVARSHAVGILAGGPATVTANGLVVRDTRSRQRDGRAGHAIEVQEGAQVEVTRAVLERNRRAAVAALGAGTAVTLADVVIRDTQSQESDRLFGWAVDAREGAQVNLTRAVLERNREVAVTAIHAGTAVTLVGVVIRDTQSRDSDRESDRLFGRAIEAREGARVDVTRAVLERNREITIAASDADTVVALADVVIRDTQSQESDRLFGRAIQAREGARVDVTRAVLERNRDVAVGAFYSGTTVTLADVVIRDTQSQESDRLFGRAIHAGEGARVSVTRAALERNREGAVVASGVDAAVTMTDVVIRDTRSQDGDRVGDRLFGRAVNVQHGARVDVARAVLEQNRDTAVGAFYLGTMVTLADVVIRDTQSQESDREGGTAIGAQQGARVDVTRAVLERNREVAVIATLAGTTVTMTDVVVRATQRRDSDGFFGSGVGAYAGGHVQMTRFFVGHNAMCGAQLAHGWNPDTGAPFEVGGTMDLSEGVIAYNAVCGANVQTQGFDLWRLQDRVLYHDNGGFDIDTSELTVPDATIPAME